MLEELGNSSTTEVRSPCQVKMMADFLSSEGTASWLAGGGRSPFMVYPHMLEKASVWGFLYKGTSPLVRGPSIIPFPEALSLTSITLGWVRTQTM